MRPIKLSMQAFGPYSGLQELDFAELGDRRFFLIHGPTGSGKTSILDAMCFALYGEMSGSGRDGDRMRSQYAGPELPMEVTFEFAMGSSIFKAMRSPAQRLTVRGKQRETQPRAEFSAFVDGRWETLATGDRRSTEQAAQVVGFRAEQFRQVIMIPQGDFRRLLTASSKEREEILRVLLRVDGFGAIEDLLKRRAKALKDELDMLTVKRDVLLGEAGAANLEELRLRMENNAAEYSGMQERMAKARSDLNDKRRQAAQGKAATEKIEALASAGKAMKSIEERAEEILRLQALLARAEAAAALSDAEASLNKRLVEKSAAQNAASLAEQDALHAEQAYGAAAVILQKEQSREGERESLSQEVFKLGEALPKARKLESLMGAEKAAAATERAAQAVKERAAFALTQNDERRQALSAEIALLESVAADEASRKHAYVKLAEAAEKRRELGSLEEELGKEETLLEATGAECAAAGEKLQRHLAEFRCMRGAWKNAQAALLAESLEEGRPCPVCGSTSHPVKAAKAEGTPTQPELDAMEDRETQYRGELGAKEARLSQLKLRKAQLETKAADCRAYLGEWAARAPQEIDRETAEAERNYREAQAAAKKLMQIKAEMDTAAGERRQLEQESEKARSAWEDAHAAYARASAELAAASAEVPENLRDGSALENLLTERKKQADLLDRALRRATEEERGAAGRAASAQATLKAARETLDASREVCEQEQRAFFNRLGDGGFESAESYQAAKRLLGEREKWKADIDGYRLELASARDRLERAAKEAEGAAAPDMAMLEAQEKQASDAYEFILRQQTAMSRQLDSEKSWCARLSELEAGLSALARRYSVAGDLARVAGGINPFGLTLQRFVLGALFDDVALAATDRLRIMSRGRYMLRRTMERARANASGGLDLEVFDEYTGDSRPVSTLSGGESFLASLALALGLADVVQSHSGGTYLETIFVDEGFGSLDPESLEDALNALIELQSTGRIVGIISHVPELRERIDARLEVMPAERGSVAKFMVG